MSGKLPFGTFATVKRKKARGPDIYFATEPTKLPAWMTDASLLPKKPPSQGGNR